MKILVTGGAGFIGGKIATALISDGHDVTVIDNLKTSSRSGVAKRARFIEIGAESPHLPALLGDCRFNAILHAGGQSSGEIGEKHPLNDVHWNVVSTLNLLALAEARGIKKFLYASSMGVYGLLKQAAPLSEEDGGQPISIYGAGKLASETYMAAFARRGITTVSLRMFNVYGPGQNMDNQLQGMLSIYLSQLMRAKKVEVRGSLERVRDFVYIDDVADAWKRALYNDHLPTGFHVYNVASGVGMSVREALGIFKEICGDFEIRVQNSTPRDQMVTVANISKIKTELGWTPKTDLRSGLAQFWRWAKGGTL